MSKFRAKILGDLLTGEARIGRAKRAAEYAAHGTPFVAVVHIEADDGSWCELDAESVSHAHTIADNWVATMNARGASCRMLRGALTGIVKLRPFYLKFAPTDFDNAELTVTEAGS